MRKGEEGLVKKGEKREKKGSKERRIAFRKMKENDLRRKGQRN